MGQHMQVYKKETMGVRSYIRACACVAGEGALKSAQLELQLQARKQEAEVELVQAKLQQQAAALVSACPRGPHALKAVSASALMTT
jgi:hypothetical protein